MSNVTLKIEVPAMLRDRNMILMPGRLATGFLVGTQFVVTCGDTDEQPAEIVESYSCLAKRVDMHDVQRMGLETREQMLTCFSADDKVDEDTMITVLKWATPTEDETPEA